MFHPYGAIMKTSMKSIIANKSSVVIELLQTMVPIIVMIYLWSSILSGRQTIGGLSKDQMIIYYIGVNFINFFIWYAVDWELKDVIHSGELSNIIHKPIEIQNYYFFRMIGDRLAHFLLLSPVLLIALGYLMLNGVSLGTILEFIVSLIFAAVLWFLFSYTVGCLSYWFENLFFVLIVKEIIVSLFAGYYFPLTILPANIQQILKWLPFQYFSAFPIDTLIKGMPVTVWLGNTLIEVSWAIIFYLILVVVNKKGLQRYSDVMG